MDRTLARKDLLLSKKAVYASPFDLKYYADMKTVGVFFLLQCKPDLLQRMADELASRVRIPYELKVVGRDLQKMVIPIKVNMEKKWTIDKKLVRTSLRQMGVFAAENTIFLGPKEISGPNFDIEAKIFRFYVVVNKQYIVPMLGRITHISVDESKVSRVSIYSKTKLSFPGHIRCHDNTERRRTG